MPLSKRTGPLETHSPDAWVGTQVLELRVALGDNDLGRALSPRGTKPVTWDGPIAAMYRDHGGRWRLQQRAHINPHRPTLSAVSAPTPCSAEAGCRISPFGTRLPQKLHSYVVSIGDAQVPESQEYWRKFLSGGHSREHRLRLLLKLLPADPRCRLCGAPFAGVGARFMRIAGKRPSGQNPNWCSSCFKFMSTHQGGAEIECTLMFADIRGSTSLAEGMAPAEFRQLLNRFYDVAAGQVFAHDGIVDKFVGDELVSMFFPLLSGEQHAQRAIEAARAVLVATGHADSTGPWLPVGAGVHTGVAWVGAVGSATRTELTALGDTVNTAAHLASAARAGEMLVSAAAAAAAGLDPALEHRRLDLKGKEQATEAIALTVGPAAKTR